MYNNNYPVDILLVEDNPGDVRLIIEAFKDAEINYNLTVASDGMEAMQIINQEGKYSNANRPKLIILDLNLPLKSGCDVLKEIKHDEALKSIPIVILTTSNAEKDITRTYKNHANAYLTKPVDLNQFINVAKSIQDFWLNNVKLP
ncbi:MAG: response regulator [Methanobacterium sp.]|jgi:CheY-like chemotaxis protein